LLKFLFILSPKALDIVVQKSFVQSSKKGLDTNLREETEKQEGEKVHKQKRCPREK